MYRIAICDDEKKELDKTESLVLSWRRRHEDEDIFVDRFEDPEKMLTRIKEGVIERYR